MPRLSPIGLALVILAQALGLPAVAVANETCESHGMTYNCLTETTTTAHVPISYNLSGTLVNGTIPPNSTANVFDSWPATIGVWNVPGGLRYGAGVETLVSVSHLSASGTPFSYTPSATLTSSLTVGYPNAENLSQLVPVLRYALTPNDNQLMSGASEFFLRGAADVNATTFDYHALEIKDETGRVLIRTSTRETMDTSLLNGRAYYRLSVPFTTGHTYSVTEYVHPLRPDDPVDSVAVWAAMLQNPGLGPAQFAAWPGDAVERLVRLAPSYSVSFHVGIGQAGIENLLPGNDTYPVQEVTFFASGGTNPTSAPNLVTLLVPLRHTRALDLFALLRVAQNGVFLSGGQSAWYHGVTGSFLADFSIPQGQAGVANTYVLTLAWNLTSGDFATYDMIPPAQAWGAQPNPGLGFLPYGHWVTLQQIPQNSQNYGFNGGVAHFLAFIPRMEVLSEQTTMNPPNTYNLGAPPPLVVDAISALIFLGHYATPAGLIFDVAELANGLPVGPKGDCMFLNGAWAQAGGQGVLCSQAVIQTLQTGFDIVFTAVACTAAVVEAGLDPLADVACAVGIGATLYDLGFDVVKIVKQAIEVVGALFSTILTWLVPVVILVVLLVLLVFAFAGLGVVKFLLVAIYAGFAAARGYTHPSEWPKFRRIYQTYIPLWTELVERRLLKMEVRP